MAKFTDATGRRVMRSTKQVDRRKAGKVAEEWEDAARKAKRGELTQAAAVKILRGLMETTTGDELRAPSCADVLNGYLSSRATLGRALSTGARYKPIMAGFLESLGKMRAAASVASLTASEIEKWRDAEVASGKAAKTVNIGLGVIRAALNAAKRRGEILSNPAEAVERVAGRGDEREPFTDGEISMLLREAGDSDWKTAILFGAWTGLRLADVANLTWAQVNLADGVAKVVPDKTERPISLALAPELHAHINSLKQGVGKAPIMPSLAGRATGSNGALAGLSNEFSRLMKRAKVVGTLGKEKKGKGRRVTSKSFHALRHAFVSRCVAGGTSESVTKTMTGHSTDSAFRRYVHLGLDAQRDALTKLPIIAGR